MSDEKTDRRSIRSRTALWQALLALLQQHDWAEISVMMICAQADVARSTFYAHFQTKQDVLDAAFDAGSAEIERQILSLPQDSTRLHSLDWLVDHVSGSHGFLRRVQGSEAGHAILARFRTMTAALLQRDLQRLAVLVSETDLLFISGGIFAVIEAWVAQNFREPKPALIARLRRQIDAVLQKG